MQNSSTKVIAIFLAASLLQSCQTFNHEKAKETSLAKQTMQAVAESNKNSAKAPSNDEIFDSLIPNVTIDEPSIVEERFDLSVKNIDARSFLLGLVDGTPYNMVVNPDVNTKISLQLKEVTISEVLASLEKIYPLMVEKQGNLFFVSSAESLTRIYPVNYLNIKREGKSQTKVAGQAVAANNNNNNQASGNNNNTNNGNNNNGNTVNQIVASELKTESSANFWSELQQSLALIIKDEEKANIVVSPQAGIVMVKALPNTQKIIQEYLGFTQRGINRQVILEAKIIEVSLNESFQAGIDWRKINTVNSGDVFTFGQTGQTLSTENSPTNINGVFSALYQGENFDAAIDLLQTQGDVQVLSSPRVSTVNNQKAIIKVGSDEFFVTNVSTTTVTGTSTSTTPNVTLTPFFSGISLDVTPQINDKGDIILHIHPIISEVDDQQKTITLGQDEFTLPLALSNVRESDSIVKAKDKQVIVIGGLMQTRVQKEDSSIPVLGDIPMVGGIFSQTRDIRVKSELVILLKASVVDYNTFQNDIEKTHDRFGQF